MVGLRGKGVYCIYEGENSQGHLEKSEQRKSRLNMDGQQIEPGQEKNRSKVGALREGEHRRARE
jgi:hypothetical protein